MQGQGEELEFIVPSTGQYWVEVSQAKLAGTKPYVIGAQSEYALRLERDSVFGHHFANRPSTPVEGRKPTKEKMVLRDSYHDRLPERIVRRDKSAFQTDAGIDKAAAGAVADPQSYYRREYRRIFNTKES